MSAQVFASRQALADEIARRLARLPNAVLAIDGRCGSGKTTLAALLAQTLPCRVVHTDDFYLPFAARRPDWRTTPLGNMDLDRLRREVLEPARRGEEIVYRAYDCPHDVLRPAALLPPRPLTVVEGSYSLAPALRPAMTSRSFSPARRRSRLRGCKRARARTTPPSPPAGSRWRRAITAPMTWSAPPTSSPTRPASPGNAPKFPVPDRPLTRREPSFSTLFAAGRPKNRTIFYRAHPKHLLKSQQIPTYENLAFPLAFFRQIS